MRNLKNAWNAELGKVDVRSASMLTAREIYTGLYTLYANIVDVTDNGSGYTPVAPSTRLLTIGSSVWWERVASTYGTPNVGYNDYQLTQPYLAIEANSPSVSQQVIRDYFLPEFSSLTMWETPPGSGSTYYTDNASCRPATGRTTPASAC